MTEPRQIEIARSLIGTHEGDNPVITGFARKIGELYPEMKSYAAGYTSDGIAWCGVFVAYCMAMSGIRPVFGPTDTDKWMWAQSWKQFGTATTSPQIGDVLVLARHVTMYAGTRDGRYIGLGGNQSDSVKESLYSPDSVDAIRRPSAAGEVAEANHPEIKLGATGPAVMELQRLLGMAEQDGEFGPNTDAAVRAFQEAHGLDPDGEVGALTWAMLLGDTPVKAVMTSKGSWYSQYDGKYHWHDSGDAPGSAALGVPDDAQGIARPGKESLGTWFMVRAPNGKVSLEIQSDLGPAVFTGRTIDISAAAAERFGYSPQNFPTDSIFTFWPVDPPKEVAGLSKQQQAIKYRDIRKDIHMADPADSTAPKTPPTDQQSQQNQGIPGANLPGLPLPQIDILQGLHYIVAGPRDKVRADLKTFLDVFNAQHSDIQIALPPSTGPAPTTTPLHQTTAFQLGGVGAVITAIAHLVGGLDPNLTLLAFAVSAGTAFLGPAGAGVGKVLMIVIRAMFADAQNQLQQPPQPPAK